MKTNRNRIVLAALALVFVGPAVSSAQQPQRDRFKAWDRNNDGKLSKEEFPERLRNQFDGIDDDRNGSLSPKEFDAYLKSREARKKKRDGRTPPKRAGGTSRPTHADVKYGSHKRNVMDVWLAESKSPTPVLVSIHGGGFRGGNKSVAPELREACLKAGISVVAITYRLSQDAIAPAQFHDAARAIQFIRHNAKTWNLDPDRIGATGGSAGAGISLWLGFHHDLADPDNKDPVLRQSSRLTCMAVSNGQTSYDPRFIKALFPEDDKVYRIEPLRLLFDADLDNLDRLSKEKYQLFEYVSPINHVTNGDAPALLTYQQRDSERDIGIHSPRFGHALKKKMDQLGIRCEVQTHLNRSDPRYVSVVMGFILKEFGMKTSPKKE